MTVKTVVSDRNGETNKLTSQALAQSLKQLAGGLQIEDADFDAVSRRILDAVPPSATHSSVVQFGGEVLAAMSTTHPDFANLAARWEISELHKNYKGYLLLRTSRFFKSSGHRVRLQQSRGIRPALHITIKT